MDFLHRSAVRLGNFFHRRIDCHAEDFVRVIVVADRFVLTLRRRLRSPVRREDIQEGFDQFGIDSVLGQAQRDEQFDQGILAQVIEARTGSDAVEVHDHFAMQASSGVTMMRTTLPASALASRG